MHNMSTLRVIWLLWAIQCLVYADNVVRGGDSGGVSEEPVSGRSDGIKGRLMVPLAYTAFDRDLRVQLQTNRILSSSRLPTTTNSSSSATIGGLSSHSSSPMNQLRVSTVVEDDNNEDGTGFMVKRKVVTSIPLYPDPFSNVTQIVIPCQHFTRGGIYELEVLQDEIHQADERLKQQLDVRWPVLKMMVVPESIVTYPEHSVDVIIEFPKVQCEINDNQAVDLPEFWLELFYCGHDVFCSTPNPAAAVAVDPANNTTTRSPTLYAELVRGFPHHRLIQLRCELFGLAGNYAVKLRAAESSSTFITQTAFIKVDWSDKFVFNVHAHSIFPCDNMGIGVLFEYPACILDHGDRVRVYGKLRADVFSLKPPTTLHYVSERRVVRGQHSLHFDCELFSEKYVEYCFVYVSQAISGAVADVRMDCIPTLPVNDAESRGGWGPWSEWTPCSSTCADGTRNRYRFCDSPPPKYGAKFCEGPAVETERCGLIAETRLENISPECLYGSLNLLTGEIPADRPEVIAEIGPGCRCGCIVHLGGEKPRRLIASSSKSCPGRAFWLIQADSTGYQIRMKLDFLRLPCTVQYLKVRDGDSLGAQLLVEYEGGFLLEPDKRQEVVVSTNFQLLIEFFSDELATMGSSCGGGFLIHVQQIPVTVPANDTAFLTLMPVRSKITTLATNLTIAHVVAVLFVGLILLISLLLGTQYIFRYRKYQLAAAIGEPDSPAQTPRASLASLLVPGRAISTSTLVSDVISLVKLRPRPTTKHSRLRESVDGEAMEKCHSPDDLHDNPSSVTLSVNGTTEDEETGRDHNKTNSDEDDKSLTSVQTLTNEGLEMDKSSAEKLDTEAKSSLKEGAGERINKLAKGGGVLNKQELLKLKRADPRMMELMEIKAANQATHLDSLETSSVNGKSTKGGGGGGGKDIRSNPLLHKIHDKKLSVSQQTLTNASYSPALSLSSRKAKIRTTNEKESKDKRNRETLLCGPPSGSDFSLTQPEDMEMDYYDYNVTNASAAPGSYFSISHLMWIPSLLQSDFEEENRIEENDGDDEGDDGQQNAGQQSPRDEGIDPGSNTETPTSPEESDEASSGRQMRLRGCNSPVKHNTLGCAISILSDDETDVRSDVSSEQESSKDKTTEKRQLASAQYYKNLYYDQMDDIQFADEEEEAAV